MVHVFLKNLVKEIQTESDEIQIQAPSILPALSFSLEINYKRFYRKNCRWPKPKYRGPDGNYYRNPMLAFIKIFSSGDKKNPQKPKIEWFSLSFLKDLISFVETCPEKAEREFFETEKGIWRTGWELKTLKEFLERTAKPPKISQGWTGGFSLPDLAKKYRKSLSWAQKNIKTLIIKGEVSKEKNGEYYIKSGILQKLQE